MSQDPGPEQWVPPGAPAPPPAAPPPAGPPVNPYQPGSPYAPSPYPANPYGRFPGRDTVQPPASQAMAGWALGLSFLPCAVTLVVSAILAIVTLARSSDGRDYGKGKAIGALCIAGGWLAIGITVLVVTGIADVQDNADRSDSGQIEEAGEVPVFELRVGDCWQEPSEAVGEDVFTVDAVPCESDHQLEVYANLELSGPEEATEGEINRMAFRACEERFAAFVGRSYRTSKLDVFYLLPTQKAWTRGERTLTCSVYQPAMGDPSTMQFVRDTLRGADR